MLNPNPINIINYAPPPPTALIFKDNEDGEDFIVITREDFARDWVHWGRNNDDYDDECVQTAWCYLCGDCEVANGEGYISIVYEEDEDEDIEAKVDAMVKRALAYAKNSLDEDAADDPM